MKILFTLVTSCVLIVSHAQQLSKDSVLDKLQDTTTFTKVEKDAAFPGGDAAWKAFLQKNMNIDMLTKKVHMPRKVKELRQVAKVQFVVAKDGSITNISTVNPAEIDPVFQKEAERLISISPNWVPAEQDGRKVKAYRLQPIVLLLLKD